MPEGRSSSRCEASPEQFLRSRASAGRRSGGEGYTERTRSGGSGTLGEHRPCRGWRDGSAEEVTASCPPRIEALVRAQRVDRTPARLGRPCQRVTLRVEQLTTLN